MKGTCLGISYPDMAASAARGARAVHQRTQGVYRFAQLRENQVGVDEAEVIGYLESLDQLLHRQSSALAHIPSFTGFRTT